MADNETTTPAPIEAEAAENAVDTAGSLEDILETLAEEPSVEPGADKPKSDETFEPLGTVTNRP